MHELLSLIMETGDKKRKLEMIDIFLREYSGKDSKVRFIASSSVLTDFYKFRKVFIAYKQENNRINEHELLEKVREFYNRIDDEYWNAHDTIYVDYKQFISDTFKNPLFVVFGSILRFFYHLSVFITWICAVALYFTLAHIISPLQWVPDWWDMTTALLCFFIALGCFGLMMVFKGMTAKENKRESKVMRNLKETLKVFWFKKEK